jgi:hypothetical protein
MIKGGRYARIAQTILKSVQLFPNAIPCELLVLQMVHKHKLNPSLAFTELKYLIITNYDYSHYRDCPFPINFLVQPSLLPPTICIN